MSNIQLHVGYIGITREGKRVEIITRDTYESTWPWESYDGEWYTDSGAFWSRTRVDRRDIVGPYEGAQQPMLGVETPVEPQVNYNDGNWHRWDGANAKCPVHGDSLVEVSYTLGSGPMSSFKSVASTYSWASKNAPITAFRVTKEYVAPVEPREFWITTGVVQIVKTTQPHCPEVYIHVREVI
jgi:hypothetical protein